MLSAILSQIRKKMTSQGPEKECVLIDDAEDNDQPGPPRSEVKPKHCAHEADWFKEGFKPPEDQVIDSAIPQEDIDLFEDLIWNKPYDRMVPGYGMTPMELARVSSEGKKGWIITSHFYWLCRQLNQQQKQARCFVLDPTLPKEAIAKLFNTTNKYLVTKLVFVISVGREDNGKVFFGTDSQQGDHWALAVLHTMTGNIHYCDTLGWPAPEHFLTNVLPYAKQFSIKSQNDMKISMAHQPNEEQHECTPECTNYPLQTCSDICGVIAMVIIAVATLDGKLFSLLLKPLKEKVQVYLCNPTEFSAYLRHVIISWIASSYIDIKKISLKPNFDCFAASSLKRKKSEDVNGYGSSKAKMLKKGRKTVTSYLQANLHREVLPKQLFKEIIDIFPTTKVKSNQYQYQYQAVNKRRQEQFFQQFVFNNSFEREKDDSLSCKSYLSEFVHLPEKMNPIILYKTAGKQSPILNNEHIAIGIQTEFQRDAMKFYGKKTICIESIPRSEQNKFNLLTVSVVHEGTHELPVAWLISNASDNKIYEVFFEALKTKTGDFKTECFIGDAQFLFYKSWVKVFQKPGKRMFCLWDTVKMWDGKIDKSVSNTTHNAELKKILSILPSIVDEKLFKEYVKHLLPIVKSCSSDLFDDLNSKYFSDDKFQYWATCARWTEDDHFIPFLMPFNHTLGVVGFLNSDSEPRMDMYMHKLLQLIRFYRCKLEIEISTAKTSRVCLEISRFHKQTSQELDVFQSASGNEWHIGTTSKNNSCTVLETEIDDNKCKLICEECNVSLHYYACTCVQYLVRAGGCSHVHFVHSFKKLNQAMGNSKIDGHTSKNGENNRKIEESSIKLSGDKKSSTETEKHSTSSDLRSNATNRLSKLKERIEQKSGDDEYLKSVIQTLNGLLENKKDKVDI